MSQCFSTSKMKSLSDSVIFIRSVAKKYKCIEVHGKKLDDRVHPNQGIDWTRLSKYESEMSAIEAKIRSEIRAEDIPGFSE